MGQQSLAKRAMRQIPDKYNSSISGTQPSTRKNLRIGLPGHRVTKQFDIDSDQRSLLIQIEYPEIEESCKPRHRFMTTYEQRKDPTDKRYQYILFHSPPYEVIAFKVPNYEVSCGQLKIVNIPHQTSSLDIEDND